MSEAADHTPAPPDDRTQFQVDRLAFFSDAVFAIAITLLTLNIHVSGASAGTPVTERSLQTAIFYLLPRILGFMLSFLVVGNYWRSHHRLFRWVRGYNPRLILINMWLLLFVSFIPAPTSFYSDYGDFQTPLVFYALSLAAVGVANSILWNYLRRHMELLDPATPVLELRLGAGRSLVIPAMCLLAIALSFVNLWMARLSLLLIPVLARAYTSLVTRLHNRRTAAAATKQRQGASAS